MNEGFAIHSFASSSLNASNAYADKMHRTNLYWDMTSEQQHVNFYSSRPPVRKSNASPSTNDTMYT